MARPPHPRRIALSCPRGGFRPFGRPVRGIPVLTLGLDGLEALRLADLEGLYQEAAAERMGVSRPTFARVLTRARAVVAVCRDQVRKLVHEAHPSASGQP